MTNRKYSLGLIFLFSINTSFQKSAIMHPVKTATVKIIFNNTVNGDGIVLHDSAYTNPFGEKFTINKFRYYVSNISLKGKGQNFIQKDHFYLIDEKLPESQTINLTIPADNYSSLHFLLGVDSLHNVSGAQSGALDPAKDMFWTWNTGYVMAKLEGTSPASNIVNHKYEFHIGGFSGKYNVLKNIELNFPENKAITLQEGKIVEIIIEADINTWWRHPNDIRIATRPAINSPGKHALAISDNYAKMFTIKKIHHH